MAGLQYNSSVDSANCINRGWLEETAPNWDTLMSGGTYWIKKHSRNSISENIIDVIEFLRVCDIQVCTSTACIAAKERITAIAPQRETPSFPWLRGLILTAVSCWTNDTKPHGSDSVKLIAVGQFCGEFIRRYSMNPPNDSTPHGYLAELFHMYNLFYFAGKKIGNLSSPDPSSVYHIFNPSIIASVLHSCGAIDNIQNGVCKHRLWNLATSLPQGIMEIVHISKMLEHCDLSRYHLDKHETCNAQVCLLNDENTTDIPQRHECESKLCGSVIFDPANLDNMSISELTATGATAWTLEANPKPQAEDYLAISHVWANGTGVGEHSGRVNECLFLLFKGFAENLNCKGIWWDTISLPSNKNKKIKCLQIMHQNYKRAKHTVVYDLELADFLWSNDGRPCLALVLSAWFSRGWTALELRSSGSVKVVFKDSSGLVLKDLDTDILEPSRCPYAHPAWKSVAAYVGWLRSGRDEDYRNAEEDFRKSGFDPTFFSRKYRRDIPTPDSLLRILKPRYTCWNRDRIIIAALLTEETLENSSQQWFSTDLQKTHVDLTKDILLRFGQLSPLSLFHDQLPISENGPWSWCPTSLFNLGDQAYFWNYEKITLTVLKGYVYGRWNVFELPDAADEFKPHASHIYQRSRIMAAFENPSKFCLLNPLARNFHSRSVPFVLAKKTPYLDHVAMDMPRKPREPLHQETKSYSVYQYIGTVIGKLPVTIKPYSSNCRL
ncbi:hypothetical protein TWF192_010815 [Orbilia oligospora]|uniref:Heterokaryon incompatibility domain-containing protein n=1 Tax=Orbilia oligospora TaxID=2813651 RepID=A0A6G1LZT3_ORBOL|nr:hypothetical protein TWF191_006956 [Orbilia oligospora]KAF3237706.1 hypothetical protein TWF192_010815 [Orbilia oligospora]